METDAISVAVLCFNSSETIIETLDSIKNQEYPKINLLINDDCSTDNTAALVRSWLEKNGDRFNEVHLYTHESNQGINKSFDFIIRQCSTKWVKPIAGDDVLFTNCLRMNLDYAEEHGVETILYSSLVPFKGGENGQIIPLKKDYYEKWYTKRLATLNPRKQYKKLLMRDINFSPTVFMNSALYREMGGIDTIIKNIEDWPLRLMFVSNGHKLHYFENDTVYYRIGNSISRTRHLIYNKRHIEQTYFAKKRIIYPNIRKYHVIYYLTELLERYRYFVIISIFRNKSNPLTRGINALMQLFELGKWPERIRKFFMRIFVKDAR